MGGKWTTYRAMAEDTLDAVQKHLGGDGECSTLQHPLLGSQDYTPELLADADEAVRHSGTNRAASG